MKLIGTIQAHDSFAYSTDPLTRTICAHDGVLYFCHTSCSLFNGSTVQAYLTTVKTFLDANPNEILTLIFTNPEGQSLPGQWEPAFSNSGIKDMVYVPPHLPMKQSDWPTLREMIDSGKRVV
ncbi:hypothetical protein PILCRDRAFT_74705, partial [Piloderma croceum F 1598]